MAGFVVSNSFGKFNAKNKVFNANLVGIPQAPATATLKEILTGWPSIPGLGYSWNWGVDGSNGFIAGHDGKNISISNSSNINPVFPWGDDSYIMEEDENQYFHYKPHPKTIAKFTVKVYSDSTSNNYANTYLSSDVKKGSQTLKEAAESSDVKCLTNYNTGVSSGGEKTAYFDVYLDGSKGDYLSVDFDKKSGSVAQFKMKTSCGTWTTSKSPEDAYCSYVAVTLREIKWDVAGCTDSQANNYNPDATRSDGTCTFTTASIDNFSVSKSSMKVGESATISWQLSNGKFSEIKLLQNGTNIMPDNKKTAQNSSITVSPTTIGNNTYKLVVTWNKANAATRNQTKTINVQAVESFVQCTDPNRQKDSNGECSTCESGYYLGDAGLCTQCSDPNRKKASDGQCGDCESGYALGTDGLCQKSGCMDETDANYDPDAVVDDASACYGTNGNGGNGGNGGDDDDDDTSDNDTTSGDDTKESPNLLIPLLMGGALLGGVLLLRK